MLLIACATILVAAVVQRLTGIGFALVATPVMVLLYGPTDGVLAVVVLGLFASLILLLTMLRDVDWRRTLWLTAAGVAASPLAAWLVSLAPSEVLLLVVGAAGLLALLGSHLGPVAAALTGRRGAIIAGAASGMLHTASGLSGPPLIAYAAGTRWPHRSFAASLQVVFIGFHLSTLLWRGLPEFELGDLSWLLAVTLVGSIAGTVTARWVSVRWARIGMLVVAWAGTVAVLVRGVIEVVRLGP